MAGPARLLGCLSSAFGLFILSYQESPPQQESPPFTARLNASRCPSWLPPAQIGLALLVPLSDLLDPNLPLQAFVFFGLLLYQLFVGVPNVLWLVKAPRGVVFALGGIGVPLAVPLAINVERALANTGLQKCNCYTKKKGEPSLLGEPSSSDKMQL